MRRIEDEITHTIKHMNVFRSSLHSVLSRRTRALLKFDLKRMKARLKRAFEKDRVPEKRKLHFGCGSRHIPGWLNVDVEGSEYDLDLASGSLPWADGSFDVAAAQQVVEHLELYDELLPLLNELHRVITGGGDIWLSCPDMEKVCKSYFEYKGVDLINDYESCFPSFSIGEAPPQHMINHAFHQWGEHKNLYDFELLRWALEEAGFADCIRMNEDDFLEHLEGFPARHDDYHALYVRAKKPDRPAQVG